LPLGNVFLTRHKGHATRQLTPHGDTEKYRRSVFRMHGDNPARNFTASHGCVVADRQTREIINESGGGTLTVEVSNPWIFLLYPPAPE